MNYFLYGALTFNQNLSSWKSLYIYEPGPIYFVDSCSFMETYQYPTWLTSGDDKEVVNTYCNKKKTCIQDNFTPKFNNLSRKMMISKMLQSGKKLSYSNTRISNYINIITAANYDSNRRLLFVIGYPLYYKYLKKVLVSQYISSKIKHNVENVYERILCRLTYQEKIN